MCLFDLALGQARRISALSYGADDQSVIGHCIEAQSSTKYSPQSSHDWPIIHGLPFYLNACRHDFFFTFLLRLMPYRIGAW